MLVPEVPMVCTDVPGLMMLVPEETEITLVPLETIDPPWTCARSSAWSARMVSVERERRFGAFFIEEIETGSRDL